MSWHLDQQTVVAYRDGGLDQARASSLEAHLISCPDCRALIASTADRARLEEVWTGLVDAVDMPRPRPMERLLRVLGVRHHVARLVAATPSLQFSWFVAIGVTIAFSVLAAQESARAALVFLVLAPLIPLAGIALAYGPGVDPTFEVGAAAPMRGSRLLFLRAATVLVSTFAILGVASATIPGLGWRAAAWVLPALGVSLVSLTLSTWIDPIWAAGWTGLGWLAASLAGARGPRGTPILERATAFNAEGQVLFVVVIAVAACVLIARSRMFDVGRDA